MKADSDRKAEFADYLRQHQSQLFGYIHSLIRDLNDADDLFQQTTVILWNKFNDFDRQRSFVAWACGVARLEVANFLRARGRQRLYFTDELNLLLIEAQDELTPLELDDRRAALTQCVAKLRERDRRLLDECYRGDGGEARAQVVRSCRLHTDLHLEARASQAGRRAMHAIDQLAPTRPARFGRRWWLAAAAVLLAAVGVWWWSQGSREDIAWLTNA